MYVLVQMHSGRFCTGNYLFVPGYEHGVSPVGLTISLAKTDLGPF